MLDKIMALREEINAAIYPDIFPVTRPASAASP
jgi:hypothetical protein